jgi:hypothetical protein
VRIAPPPSSSIDWDALDDSTNVAPNEPGRRKDSKGGIVEYDREEGEVLRNTRLDEDQVFADKPRPKGNPFHNVTPTTSHVPENPENAPAPAQALANVAKDGRRMSRKLDIDSFTELLMRGRQSSVKSPSDQVRSSAAIPESSSATDISSNSHQSLSDQVQDGVSGKSAFIESPALLEDRQQQTPKRQEKPKPPPPRQRHGKNITSKGPQTVSFDDFTPTIPTDAGPKVPAAPPKTPIESQLARENSVSRSRPAEPIAEELPRPLSGGISPREAQKMPLPVPDFEPPKKTAPAPPLARRSTVTKRPRSNTATSNISQADESPSSYPPSISESTNSSLKTAPPPPPPARRAGGSGYVPTVPAVSPHADSSTSSLMSPPPPPPPRRRSSKNSIDLNTPGSFSLQRSRGSLELRRTSIDSERRVSGTQATGDDKIIEETSNDELPRRSNLTSPEPEPEPDILADMDAFQRELDELRAKYQQGRD